MNNTRLKIELLCQGARATGGIEKGRRAGAGPAGGKYFILSDSTCIEIPLQGRFVENSPYTLTQDQRRWVIQKGERCLAEVTPVPRPMFYDKKNSDGVPMSKIAILHGKDCLASTVYSKCVYWAIGKQCQFCGIELGPADRQIQKKPEQLGEVAEEAFKEGVAKHVTLTTGTPSGSDKGALLLAEATKAIKEHINLPVHVQIEPPKKEKFLEMLFHAGADSVGLHIESFDPKVFRVVCPAKPDSKDYFKAWRSAVELFGEGQVSTFVIVGIGETDESILEGVKKTATIGVIPYLLPLRPISGTAFEDQNPPQAKRMIMLYQKVAETLHKVGLDPSRNKAGCVKCGACAALREAFLSPPSL